MPQPQAETRFIELMAELFQMDEAEALDFGWYRVIRRHNREVRAFLGEMISTQGWKTLKGGRLSVFSPATWNPPCNRISISIINTSSGISNRSPIAKPKEHYQINPNSFKKDQSTVGDLTAIQLQRSAAWNSVLDKRHRAISIPMKLCFSDGG
ncbi:MAG: hypothetical protein WBQ37_12880 [Candidatus Competibacter sp.]